MPSETVPPLDRHLLLSRPWRLASPGAEERACVLHFLPDGRIGRDDPARGAELRRWSLEAGRLLVAERVSRRAARFACRPAVALDAERDRRAGVDAAAVLHEERGGAPGPGRTLTALEAPSPPGAAGAPPVRVADRMPRRRDLVVLHADGAVRLGDWARDIPPERRGWDLCLCWHDRADGHPDRPEARYHAIRHGSGRFRAVASLLDPAGPLRHHDRVALLPGGAVWRWSEAERAFASMRARGLGIASLPGLSDPATGGEAVLFSRAALAACAAGFGGDDAADADGRAARWAARLGLGRAGIPALDPAGAAP